MIIPRIKSVKTTEKEFKIEDFGEFTEYAGSCFAKKEILPAPSVKANGFFKSGLKCVKLYDVGFAVYYCSDGRLYRKKDGAYESYGIPAFSCAPDIFNVVFDGKKTVAAVCESGAYLLNDRTAFLSVIKGDDYITYKNSLFIAKGRKIFVSSGAEYSGDDVVVNTDNFLRLSGRAGVSGRFLDTADGLYLLCTRGIVKIDLSYDGTGYSLKELSLSPVKTEPRSAAAVGKGFYFINSDGLNFFDGKTLKKVSGLLDGKNFFIAGKACKKDGIYMLPIVWEEKNLVYCYDAFKNADCFLNASGILIAGEGKTVSSDGKIGCVEECAAPRVWESLLTDLGEAGFKTVYGININCDSDVKVKISGGDVSRTFTVKKGEGSAALALRAKEFKLRLEFSGDRAKIHGVTLKYRV